MWSVYGDREKPRDPTRWRWWVWREGSREGVSQELSLRMRKPSSSKGGWRWGRGGRSGRLLGRRNSLLKGMATEPQIAQWGVKRSQEYQKLTLERDSGARSERALKAMPRELNLT